MEMLTIYEPGDRLATLTAGGLARVWEVQADGTLIEDSEGRHRAYRPVNAWNEEIGDGNG